MSQHYAIPTETIERETEVKKSRFIARATYATNRQEAMAFLAQAKADYPDARHHCWAYLLGDPSQTCSAAMSDDGEPSGVAGRPILNVIQHKLIGDVMVVVSRYFGGIKLGAGGMVRAYSGVAECVLSALKLERQQPVIDRLLSGDFSQEQPIRHWAESRAAKIGAVTYKQGVSLVLTVPVQHESALIEFCSARGIELD
ncbi:MAG: YigZ family protein [Candidatus Polarisedimenticolaceae bacterium]|nr:YigZ family protein [Candidatus Polarisedimenticolaceae bacterium]